MELDKKHIKILVIDDEPGIQNLLDYVLKLEGYTVVTASNGEEGLEAFKNDKFQLVITDVKMPKIDGLQVLDVVKTTDPDTEIIMITGFGTVNAAVQAIRKGAYDFIQKPFNLEEMLSLIAKALEKAELRALVAFHDISKAIFSIVSLNDLLPVLTELSLKLLHADDVSIFLLKDGADLECAVSQGLKEPCQFRDSLAREVIEKSRTPAEECVIVGPSEATPGLNDNALAFGIQSFLVSPLLSNGKLLGAWCACRTVNDEPFTRNEEDYANIFVAQVSQAIYNAQLYADLSAKASTLEESHAELTGAKQELAQTERLAAIARLSPILIPCIKKELETILAMTKTTSAGKENSPGRTSEASAMKEAFTRIHRLLNRVSHFVTPNEEESSLDMHEVMTQSLELLICPASPGCVVITREFDPALKPLTADRGQMQHLIIELLSYILVRLQNTAVPAITIKTKELGNRLLLEFIDNGPLITPQGEDDFFALMANTPDAPHFSTVRDIISKHNGSMTVRTQEDKHTVFSIEFPRH